MKLYDKDKTYKIKFKNDSAESSFWIHMHCLLATNPLSHFTSDEDYINHLKKRTAAVYQLMSLYRDASPGHWGQAYGGFLNLIQDLDSEALRYLTITEIKEKERNYTNEQ